MKKLKIPECKGCSVDRRDFGIEYDCMYKNAPECEDCACNFYNTGGTISPISGKPMKSLIKELNKKNKL